ncbi:hypothetical protein [Actinomadura sp. 9N215]|uniref:hypothetical protein n=1 Tax=Actinomadura sp. 9N215 TaxID=3375150 RepID=UPI00379CDEBA
MLVGERLGVAAAAAVLAGSVLSFGAVAGASEPPPEPGVDGAVPVQPQLPQEQEPPQGAQEEEGQGSGGIYVGPEGHAKALERLQYRTNQRARWFCGEVVIGVLKTRKGPGKNYDEGRKLRRGAHVVTDWYSIVRNQGYLWVKLRNSDYWIADYNLTKGKWYVKYASHC